MENAIGTNHRLRFKAFELDLHTRELYRNGIRLRVQGQPIDVLEMLLERPGELVTREQLRKKLWPQDTFVDFEHSLNSAVTRLRDALGDRAEDPIYIETLPRLGYRFICPMETGESPESTGILSTHGTERAAALAEGTASAPPVTNETRPRFLRRWRWAVAASVAGVAVGAGAFLWYIRQPLPSPRIGETRQLTRDVRWRYKRPLGVDGGRVYFTGTPRGLFAVGSSGDVETILPWTPDLPVWADDLSPDGGYFLGLVSNNFLGLRSNSSLWVFTTTGKQVRYLASGTPLVGWSPDGKQAIYSTREGKVYTIPTAGGEPRLLFASHSDAGLFSWSPDGKRIRFTAGVGPLWSDRIWEVASDGSNLHEFLPGMKGSVGKCCGRWTPDGAFYIFASAKKVAANPLEFRQLWAVDERSGKLRRPSHDPVQLTFDPMQWTFPLISQDSRTIFATGILNQGELVRFDTRTGQYVQYMGGISADWLDFSRDGKYVAYVSYPDQKVWRADRDGSDRILLAEPEGAAYGIRWSPDGTKILFCVGLEVYVVSSQGGRPERVLFPPGENPGDPTWSPNGRRLAYTVDRVEHMTPTGIRILDLETHQSTPLPVAPVPVWSPRWSPDGRYIFCAAAPSGSAVYDTKTHRWIQFPEKIDVGYMNWARDSRSVYFLGGSAVADISDGVYRISIPSGHVDRVIDLTNFRFWGSIANAWLGLDPDDNPLLLRDAGSVELYALTLER